MLNQSLALNRYALIATLDTTTMTAQFRAPWPWSRRAGILLGAILPLCAGPACARTSRPLRANIQSADSSERILAIKAAADAGDASAIPLIVDRLEDEDQGVQFFAILALERMTGKRFGYEVGQPPGQRMAAIERWRAFVQQGEHKLTMNKQDSRNKGAAMTDPAPDHATPTGAAAAPGE